mmetsp:Transcript_8049/g.33665  ORF Transcript_8049/g.33665 Transcript_8049/m.33665 type:complete len:317 (+) Transcript_8049:2009-2959(+)
MVSTRPRLDSRAPRTRIARRPLARKRAASAFSSAARSHRDAKNPRVLLFLHPSSSSSSSSSSRVEPSELAAPSPRLARGDDEGASFSFFSDANESGLASTSPLVRSSIASVIRFPLVSQRGSHSSRVLRHSATIAGKRPYARRMFATVSSSARRLNGPTRIVTSPVHRISHVFIPTAFKATRSATRAGDETNGSETARALGLSALSDASLRRSAPSVSRTAPFSSISTFAIRMRALCVTLSEMLLNTSRSTSNGTQVCVPCLYRRTSRNSISLPRSSGRSTRGTAMFGRFTMVCVTNPSAPNSETRESSRAPTTPS